MSDISDGCPRISKFTEESVLIPGVMALICFLANLSVLANNLKISSSAETLKSSYLAKFSLSRSTYQKENISYN